MAVEEMHSFMAERNRAALDASQLLFGTKGIIKAPDVCVGCVLPQQRRVVNQSACDKPVIVKAMSDGWQPRWPGDMGDPFEPYTVSPFLCALPCPFSICSVPKKCISKLLTLSP